MRPHGIKSAIFTRVSNACPSWIPKASFDETAQQYPSILQLGDTGNPVRVLQYYLAVIGMFYETVPPINVDGILGEATRQAVIAFQKTYGLNPTVSWAVRHGTKFSAPTAALSIPVPYWKEGSPCIPVWSSVKVPQAPMSC